MNVIQKLADWLFGDSITQLDSQFDKVKYYYEWYSVSTKPQMKQKYARQLYQAAQELADTASVLSALEHIRTEDK